VKIGVMVAAGVFVMAIASVVAGGEVAAKAGRADRNPGHLKVALIAMKSLYSDTPDVATNRKNIQINLDRHMYFIDRAAAEGAEFIGFPEASISGYHYSPNMTWLRLDGPEIKAIQRKAAEKDVYVGVGIAEEDAAGKRWETQVVIGPDGKIVGTQHKIWLTKEKGFIGIGTEHNVFEVKGVKMGIIICADGTDFANIKALADRGAKIIYAPHANTTGGTIAGWYRFRARWAGQWDGNFVKSKTSNEGPEADMPSGGWMSQLKLYAALVNCAGLYNPDYNPPVAQDSNNGFASGAWIIGPDGSTLAQIPTSTNKADSKEYILIYNIPIGKN